MHKGLPISTIPAGGMSIVIWKGGKKRGVALNIKRITFRNLRHPDKLKRVSDTATLYYYASNKISDDQWILDSRASNTEALSLIW